jgi:hypothetical protein
MFGSILYVYAIVPTDKFVYKEIQTVEYFNEDEVWNLLANKKMVGFT